MQQRLVRMGRPGGDELVSLCLCTCVSFCGQRVWNVSGPLTKHVLHQKPIQWVVQGGWIYCTAPQMENMLTHLASLIRLYMNLSIVKGKVPHFGKNAGSLLYGKYENMNKPVSLAQSAGAAS